MQHKFDEAESLYQRALVIQEKTRGSEHAEVFKTMSNLAEVYVLINLAVTRAYSRRLDRRE